jgi:hypothetical protein
VNEKQTRIYERMQAFAGRPLAGRADRKLHVQQDPRDSRFILLAPDKLGNVPNIESATALRVWWDGTFYLSEGVRQHPHSTFGQPQPYTTLDELVAAVEALIPTWRIESKPNPDLPPPVTVGGILPR